MNTLYLVATPLGDPDDITLRALRILREVLAVAADDFAVARFLLDQLRIETTIIPYGEALDLLSTGDVALIANAGTPGIGDAAQAVVREAVARGVRIEPLPGADAAITALVLSGLPTDAFIYIGALPDDLSRFAREPDTLIFTSHDALHALQRLLEAFGDRPVCVAARLTQPNETIYRGSLSAAVADWHDQGTRGEVGLVVAGAPPQPEQAWDESQVRVELRRRLATGEALKVAAKTVANVAGWDRRTVYALGVDEKAKTP